MRVGEELMPDKYFVRGHFRTKPEESGKVEKGYPRNERKCKVYCSHSRQNAQGQLVCDQYFDFVPRPFNCEKDGKFAPR